ncbi:CPBP family intramembrane glutamic endopeptidase [Hugenholtzia roseola]|uniref:CPBP family intramembrane glutamic endopeptidase n=1 Tax=Hugenholtzia roseola TaxID=1002 RepID=UPI00041AB255|nr:CPBP family intramembrane glutamic endopeptidase [Hugenholtzia roseola]
MESNFIYNAKLGKNEWWRYVLSILAPIFAIVLANLVIKQILPSFKALFPDGELGKELGTYSLLLLVFGSALFVFLAAASRLHQRRILSFITVKGKMDWKGYFLGFFIWAILLSVGSLLADFNKLDAFLQNLNRNNLALLFLVGFISIGIQSFFEEVLIRGYFLQGMQLRFKNLTLLIATNALLFGGLHFGYGIESFLSSFFFGVAFAIIVVLRGDVVFVSGAHNANNLLLSLLFLDISEATSEGFSWKIDWLNFSLHLLALLLLVIVVYKLFRE